MSSILASKKMETKDQQKRTKIKDKHKKIKTNGKVRRLSLNRLAKSIGHESNDSISPPTSVSPRNFTFAKEGSLNTIFSSKRSPSRSPKDKLTQKMYEMLSLDPVKNCQLIKSILYITLELLNNETFFEYIKYKDVCENYLKLVIQAKIPVKFINFCIDQELEKRKYDQIFRENTPTNNAILSFMDMDNKDGNFLSIFASRYIEDKNYTYGEILDLIIGIVNQFFTIMPFYTTTFFYVLKYIQNHAHKYDKNPTKIITILLFLRVINPAITYCYRPNDSTNLKQNKLNVMKILMQVANEMVSSPDDDFLKFNEGEISISKENLKIYQLKQLISSKLQIMDLKKGEKIHYVDTDIDFKIVIDFCSYILKNYDENNILPRLNEKENVEKLIITNICKLVAMIGCGEKDSLDDESKELIKKLLLMKFMV